MAVKREPRIGVLGAGAWGTAIASHLAGKQFPVELWCFEKDLAQEINERHTNERYLPGVTLSPLIHASSEAPVVAEDKDYLFLAVPSLYLLSIVKQILPCADIREGRTLIGILTKGLIDTTHGVKLITDAIEDYLPGRYKGKLVSISGPSHAEEVSRGKITGLISASRSGRNSIRCRELLSGGRLVVFSSLDVKGVQVAGAMKNVIAIAFGMLDALKETSSEFGDNTESLLLAAGLSEIQRVGRLMGATHPETFTSIAGVGDLDVTCRSVYGRNRRFGRQIILERLIEGCASIKEVIERLPSFGSIPEGVVTALHVHSLMEQRQLELPISGGVYRVLNREVDPLSEVGNIVERIIARTKGNASEKRRLPRMGRSTRSSAVDLSR